MTTEQRIKGPSTAEAVSAVACALCEDPALHRQNQRAGKDRHFPLDVRAAHFSMDPLDLASHESNHELDAKIAGLRTKVLEGESQLAGLAQEKGRIALDGSEGDWAAISDRERHLLSETARAKAALEGMHLRAVEEEKVKQRDALSALQSELAEGDEQASKLEGDVIKALVTMWDAMEALVSLQGHQLDRAKKLSGNGMPSKIGFYRARLRIELPQLVHGVAHRAGLRSDFHLQNNEIWRSNDLLRRAEETKERRQQK